MIIDQILFLIVGGFVIGVPSYYAFAWRNAIITDLLAETVKELSDTKVALETAFAAAPEARAVYTVTKTALERTPPKEKTNDG